ncbi:hypothetical protein SISSUDRAFT_1043806 [Sistotremastrum suecicum HHB10207 ss-3]|uniref:Uncharacterized protein n=1 Tax=Sistotremastrum suecicum HHB10207 ss-3 TaxID=1314776 RepID=A0A166FIR4_9AGAM|nr:hypothetical protein SISSUDRAFT_1043806 [Sistotremastrum suecicum HHB10207 ss-3]
MSSAAKKDGCVDVDEERKGRQSNANIGQQPSKNAREKLYSAFLSFKDVHFSFHSSFVLL